MFGRALRPGPGLPLLIMLAAFLAVLAACSNDRPLQYIQSLPEDTLAYPDSTLTCSAGSPETPGIEGPHSATSSHCYTAPGSEAEVVAWYAKELAARGWKRQDLGYVSGTMPRWVKGFAVLMLHSIDVDDEPDATAPIDYRVKLMAQDTAYDHTAKDRLVAAPEADLSHPGSVDRRDLDIGRFSGPAGAALISRSYFTRASAPDVDRHFLAEMAARGWSAVDTSTIGFSLGFQPQLAWQKDDLIAGLSSIAIKPNSASDFMPTHYTFAIVEVLTPDQIVNRPW